ncbi:MAG: hypothetical protein EA355_09235 [Rhodobacteraceae bacterium]|nr:MAG: hypothetical protein EA355_09235 [Paracoccaceae bacterium]
MRLSLLFAAISVAAPAAGQVPNPWRFEVSGLGVHQFAADLDGGPGDVAITRVFGRASVAYSFTPRVSIGLSLGAGTTDFDFGGGASLGGIVSPWSRIDDYRISAPVRFGIGDDVSAFIIPSVRWNGESGASTSDSQTEGVIAGAVWRVSPSLSIGPGVGAFSRLGSGSTVLPILLLDWDITDRLSVGTGSGLAATEGPGLEARYGLTETFTLAAGARYESVRFRLDRDGPTSNGIGETQTLPIYVSATWAPSPRTNLSALLGLDVGGEVTLRDSGGGRIESRDIDPAPFLGVAGQLRF